MTTPTHFWRTKGTVVGDSGCPNACTGSLDSGGVHHGP